MRLLKAIRHVVREEAIELAIWLVENPNEIEIHRFVARSGVRPGVLPATDQLKMGLAVPSTIGCSRARDLILQTYQDLVAAVLCNMDIELMVF